MNTSMINASVTMGQLQQKLDTTANNMANSNTNGFKRRNVQFSDLLFQQINNKFDSKNEVGRLTPVGIRAGSGARVSSTAVSLEMGAIKTTERPLDIALLSPELFFQVQKKDTDGKTVTEYTRDGAFYLKPGGGKGDLELVTSDGSAVMGDKGPIRIPAGYKEISIGQNGNISVTLSNGRVVNSGRMALVDVVHPQLLKAVGHNFRIPAGVNENQVVRAANPASVNMQQGALEMSNVNTGNEMTDIINMQRSYQFNARTITMADQMMGLVNGIR
ncbi:flagellar hook-basal body protein [Fictibacillus sp. WQ 8-8]|uniref:flagellar hook-basal body protein n=1 Tax=unclassified Fictibacillus TaxID=2644029 RepID=UPI0006A78C66|nr:MULTISPECIES: flagellar hook-basal body protein [unclassified Fictibacillus]MCQ6264865.1 flagellar hook-basal body protein [Fictibacillus sp. WQ 8-8]UZJ79216.1 flagellar hook-basal body protein [Fictibacillus sp. KU28468]